MTLTNKLVLAVYNQIDFELVALNEWWWVKRCYLHDQTLSISSWFSDSTKSTKDQISPCYSITVDELTEKYWGRNSMTLVKSDWHQLLKRIGGCHLQQKWNYVKIFWTLFALLVPREDRQVCRPAEGGALGVSHSWAEAAHCLFEQGIDQWSWKLNRELHSDNVLFELLLHMHIHAIGLWRRWVDLATAAIGVEQCQSIKFKPGAQPLREYDCHRSSAGLDFPGWESLEVRFGWNSGAFRCSIPDFGNLLFIGVMITWLVWKPPNNSITTFNQMQNPNQSTDPSTSHNQILRWNRILSHTSFVKTGGPSTITGANVTTWEIESWKG